MARLVVIHGPANTGKIARVWEVAAEDAAMRIVHRDTVRVSFGRLLEEAHLSEVIADMVYALLARGYSVVTVSCAMQPQDARRWRWIAAEAGADLQWVETGVCSSLERA